MRLAFAIASALLAAVRPDEFGDAFCDSIAGVEPIVAPPIRDPNVMITKATIATAAIDNAAIFSRARGDTPEIRKDMVFLPLKPTLRT
jgi:hypothetical protein